MPTTDENTLSPLLPKPNGRITTLERRVDELEHKISIMAWLDAERKHNAKLAVAKQMLQSPDIQERLGNAIVSRIGDKLM